MPEVRTAPGGRLRVLESFPEPGPQTNPYISQLLIALRLEPGLDVQTFSWRRALRARYDVFHVHWPDALLQARSPGRRFVKYALFALLLLRLAARRVAVVRTVHNSEAHERHFIGDALDRLLERMTAARILLSAGTTADAASTIPHGHYRDWLSGHPYGPRQPGRVVFVGHLRPYKGIRNLLAAFDQLGPDSAASLVLAGQPRDADLTAAIRAAVAKDGRIAARIGYATDAEFVALVSEAQLVVLPYQRFENSGVALAALSLDRPVLVPRTDSSQALADEVGAEWVQLFTAPLDAAQLSRALAATAKEVAERPRFVDREWASTAFRHRGVFERATYARRPTRQANNHSSATVLPSRAGSDATTSSG